ncbi:MAG: hypothetical protein ACREIA_17125 [Opitutaceae bacterium]
MLLNRLRDITDPELLDLLRELEELSGRTVQGHSEINLLNYLQITQRDLIRDRRQRLDASGYYRGSKLKTRIEKFADADSPIMDLVEALCRNFRVSVEQVVTKTLYVLNDILNEKSKLRKLPPVRFFSGASEARELQAVGDI